MDRAVLNYEYVAKTQYAYKRKIIRIKIKNVKKLCSLTEHLSINVGLNASDRVRSTAKRQNGFLPSDRQPPPDCYQP